MLTQVDSDIQNVVSFKSSPICLLKDFIAKSSTYRTSFTWRKHLHDYASFVWQKRRMAKPLSFDESTCMAIPLSFSESACMRQLTTESFEKIKYSSPAFQRLDRCLRR